MNSFSISSNLVEITKIYTDIPGLRVDLAIGQYEGAIIDPKISLLSSGFVYLCNIGETRWEHVVEDGCTDDPRIVEIATKLVKGQLSERDVHTVYPPLKSNL